MRLVPILTLALCTCQQEGRTKQASSEPVQAEGLAPSQAKPPAPAPPAQAGPPTAQVPSIQIKLQPSLNAPLHHVVVPACPYAPTDKASGIPPTHALAYIGGKETKTSPCGGIALDRAAIYATTVEHYRESWPAGLESIGALRDFVTPSSRAPTSPIPFLPLVDAHFDLAERVEYVAFPGGYGFLFLGQLAIEPDTIGDELAYFFQGISLDAKRVVVAVIPATIDPALPSFEVPDDLDWNRRIALHEPYLRRVRQALRTAAPSSLSPRPDAVAKSFGTLRIQTAELAP